MSRLVEAPIRKSIIINENMGAPMTGTSEKETWREQGERVAKYIPADVLAVYTAAINLIATKEGTLHLSFRLWAGWIVFVICLVCTPIWLGGYTKDLKVAKLNQIMGTLAFAFWAYAFPAGPFFELDWHQPVVAGLLILFFAFFASRIYPTAADAAPAQDKKAEPPQPPVLKPDASKP